MSCNCKNKVEFEEEYGTRENESLLEKLGRYMMKVLFFVIMLAAALVVIPTLILTFVFQAAFTPNKMGIRLPSFMSKYMR